MDPRIPISCPPRGKDQSRIFRALLLGFAKVYVLHHASREPIYGSGIRDDLNRHGYQVSKGTIYPLLRSLHAAAFLQHDHMVVDGQLRKYYEITPLGQRALKEARRRIRELVAELTTDDA